MKEPSLVSIAGEDRQFLCKPDEYLLDAALRSGVRLAHNCRGGACGTCKADILEGAVDHGWVMSFAISDQEKVEGKCLLCVSRPASSRITVRPHAGVCDTVAALSSPFAEHQVTIVASHLLSPRLRAIRLALPASTSFRFDAGQHVELIVDGATARPYSIAEAPGDKGRAPHGLLTFYVSRHEGGRASTWLHEHAHVGRALRLRGPYGAYCAPPPVESQIVMMAGGSGLAPILSLARCFLAKGHHGPLSMFFSLRSPAEVFALDELVALQTRYPNFSFALCLTRTAAADLPKGWRSGRIPDLLGRSVATLSATRVFIAGSPAFVGACIAAALDHGATQSDIWTEAYAFQPPTQSAKDN
jgi:CDP-4-dehydro-6-deoxyglucose reductase